MNGVLMPAVFNKVPLRCGETTGCSRAGIKCWRVAALGRRASTVIHRAINIVRGTNSVHCSAIFVSLNVAAL